VGRQVTNKKKEERRKRFFERAKEIHGDKYDYSKVEYNGARNEIEIICREHGSFFQTASNHINRPSGCALCGLKSMGKSIRMSRDKDDNVSICMLYIIKLTGDSEEFYKIGITNNIKRRHKEIRSASKYNIEVIHIIIDTRYVCSLLENKLLKKYDKKNMRYRPKNNFPGRNECFIIN